MNSIEEKKWTVNGSIDLGERENKYFVPHHEGLLMEKITEGAFILFQGRRGIGKTTQCFELENLLPKYTIIYVSFQKVNFNDFWNSFGKSIERRYPFINGQNLTC